MNGKIAQLPPPIREQLNQRLRAGETGRRLLVWLNGLPETRQLLAAGFADRPINEPNLTAWKMGGYQQWLARQDILAHADRIVDLAKANRVTDHLATLLAARYAVMMAGWTGQVTPAFRSEWRALRGLSQAVAQLRRGDQGGTRLELAQAQLDWRKEKIKEIKVN